MPQADNIIELRQVSFSRGSKVILDNVDLTIARRKIIAIMGPSGTGKTTLLRLIGGQLKPDSGQVLVDGHDVCRLSIAELYGLRRRMGMLFQRGALFTDMSVFENIAFPLREHTALDESMTRDLVMLILEAVGLRGAERLAIHELSGGMAHRVALARAIVLGPELMLYDEPFTGQDPIVKGVLLKLIRQLNDAFGLTSIIVSHDVAETASISDELFIIAGGRIIAHGAPQEVLQEQKPMVHQFVHGLADGPVCFRYPTHRLAEDLCLS